MVPPAVMCRKHLLGSHVELHMLAGSILKNISMDGYVKNGLIELKSLFVYHDKCAIEMKNRGYNHKTPLKSFNLKRYILEPQILNSSVDTISSMKELLSRCPECTILFTEQFQNLEFFINEYSNYLNNLNIYKENHG
jgi:hypothetical protein